MPGSCRMTAKMKHNYCQIGAKSLSKEWQWSANLLTNAMALSHACQTTSKVTAKVQPSRVRNKCQMTDKACG